MNQTAEVTRYQPIAAIAPMPAISLVFREAIASRAAELRAASKSANTRKAYASDWKQFTAWCLFVGAESLPARPETVEAYLAALTIAKTPHGREYAVQTIARRLAAIAHYHREAG